MPDKDPAVRLRSSLGAMSITALLITSTCAMGLAQDSADEQRLRNETVLAMKRAAGYYREQVAVHGGYVYFYSLDLQQRWGEGLASKDQIWVQPPGTPTVGMGFLAAFEATGDDYYLQAATAAAEALVYGQMRSGGWTNCIDFNPRGDRVALYRNGRGRGRNTSSLDDGQTASAIRLLIRADRAHQFKHRRIHTAAEVALAALLNAQYPNGAFPQVWDDDKMPDPPARSASYPEYNWRSEGRIKNYWDMYTLNDNVPGYVAETLIDAHAIYRDDRYLDAARRLGDFLISAQMPDPQPGWAQQYNYEMKPIWARKFEPPAVSGDESQEAVQTLLTIHAATGDDKYLAPIPSALAYLRRSLLTDGRLARYYELKTNIPLYMARKGKVYRLTYDDDELPTHYGWKTDSRLDELSALFNAARSGKQGSSTKPAADRAAIRRIIGQLDQQGRWVSTYGGERLVGQAKLKIGAEYLSSELFSRNLTKLAGHVSK
ncbi:MAG: pectate lyase [Pirellulaceae bacterium]|nr:pectate lyase [Pirellulaceae bacterium]MDP7020636.1 pectate lyase [Pirellulaceae bacterium]